MGLSNIKKKEKQHKKEEDEDECINVSGRIRPSGHFVCSL